MDKKIKTLTALLIITMVFIGLVYAYVSWTKKFCWTAEFEVYHEDKTTLWNEGDELLGVDYNKNFWVKNIGSIDIVVSVIEDPQNCTVSWSSTVQTIQPGNSVWFNLTITVWNEPSGYYSFQFTKTG